MTTKQKNAIKRYIKRTKYESVQGVFEYDKHKIISDGRTIIIFNKESDFEGLPLKKGKFPLEVKDVIPKYSQKYTANGRLLTDDEKLLLKNVTFVQNFFKTINLNECFLLDHTLNIDDIINIFDVIPVKELDTMYAYIDTISSNHIDLLCLKNENYTIAIMATSAYQIEPSRGKIKSACEHVIERLKLPTPIFTEITESLQDAIQLETQQKQAAVPCKAPRRKRTNGNA